jgi:hypothetical protein
MPGPVSVEQAVDEALAGRLFSSAVEHLGEGITMLELDDDTGAGAPISLVWTSNGSVVVTVGKGGRIELPADLEGLSSLRTLLNDVVVGGVEETIYEHGSSVLLLDPHGPVRSLAVQRGLRRRALIERRRYAPYPCNPADSER